jgi:hypothetical protein
MPWRRVGVLFGLLLLLADSESSATPLLFVVGRAPARHRARSSLPRHQASSSRDQDMTLLLLERLGPRLASVLRLVPTSARVVADVGCDHNRLNVALALTERSRRRGRLERLIGVEKAAAPLEAARRNLERLQRLHPMAAEEDGRGGVVVNGCTVVELRLGDGLGALSRDDDVDTVCCAGMGTCSMEEVLSPSSKEQRAVLAGVRHLVLQVRFPGGVSGSEGGLGSD